MKNSMKKFISFVLVAAMSLAISVPGFAAEKGRIPDTQAKMISSKATASGKTYGPWFGHDSYSYNTKNIYKYTVIIANALFAAINPYLGEKAAQATVGVLTASVSSMYLDTDDYTYGTVSKRYREVYIAGEFAYFQTEATTKAYYHKDGKNHYLGTDVQYFEGNAPTIFKN